MLNWMSSAEIYSTGLTNDSAPVKPGGIGYIDGSAVVHCAVWFGDRVKTQ